MNAPVSLTPEMTSRKLVALGFIRRYIGEHGQSPSYGEIGAGLGVSSNRARDLVRRLVRDGKLERERGARRGIRMPLPKGIDSVEQALMLLRAQGFKIDGDVLSPGDPFTYSPLPMLPALEHIPDIEFGNGAAGHAADVGRKARDRRQGAARDRGARTPECPSRAA